jgi:signal transduction histidine kinase/HPt (histidine-containing phosphotransfer) domain-containing protein/ActR/RegA family two-component response regulator
MSIRFKALVAISIIAAVVTAANLAIGLFFTRAILSRTVTDYMTSVVNIADALVSTKIQLLKADAATVAERLSEVGDDELADALREQTNAYADFMALTVFEASGVVAAHGDTPAPAFRLATSEYLKRAFSGKSVISTARLDAFTGKLVMRVCVPIGHDGKRVLAVTFPGTLFSDTLNDFRIWETGGIFIMDEHGSMIANTRDFKALRLADRGGNKADATEDGSVARFFDIMATSGSGRGIYALNGEEMVFSWKALDDPAVGWSIGVTAPMDESPASNVRRELVFSALLFLALSVTGAFFIAGGVARPYERIEEQNASLARLNEVARSASEAKSRFLANTSHEMRTPLNAVVGLSELTLGEYELPDEAMENVEKIYSSGVTLLGIVNDLLDLSKIEAGKFELAPSEYDVPSLINDTVTLNITRIGSKPLTFGLDVDGSLPGKLFGDELRVKQIFNNLLSNAFKYTQEGYVRWKLSCERDGDRVWLIGSVSDTGVGIRDDDVKKLFSDYNQVDAKSSRSIEGTGLGLAITKNLAERMDGGIQVSSQYGWGSVFTVRVSQGFVSDVTIGDAVARDLQNFHYAKHKRARNEKFLRVKLPYASVLVVDDVGTNLDVARGILKPYGMRVDCVKSGREAIELIKRGETRYNAIFMDHMMPAMDGIEATQRIRDIGTEYARNIPILALTANAIVGNEEMFLANGFQAFLTKPIDIMAMDAAIRRWVRNREQEAAIGLGIPEEGNSPEPAGATIFDGRSAEGIDVERGLALYGGDGSLYLKVLRSYADNTPGLLDDLRDPERDGLPGCALSAHSVKGASRSIGAYGLGAMAEALESAARSGDLASARNRSVEVIEAAEKIMENIAALTSDIPGERAKPRAQSPDAEILDALAEACKNFDVDGLDAAMERLEGFEYESESGANLMNWLREQARVMGFKRIHGRLSGADGSEASS